MVCSFASVTSAQQTALDVKVNRLPDLVDGFALSYRTEITMLDTLDPLTGHCTPGLVRQAHAGVAIAFWLGLTGGFINSFFS